MRPAFLDTTTQIDPLDLGIEPGFRVRDLSTVEECAARPCLAGRILLASIVGMAICATWIAITWRAW